MKEALVLKKQADLFTVEFEDETTLDCTARKVLKKEGVFVGDKVIVDEENTLAKLCTRKNVLIRPPVANINKMFIVMAPVPKPDLYTVDKMILFCKLNNIIPVVCINKADLNQQFCENLAKIYCEVAKTLIFSSFNQSVNALEAEIDGVCVLAGQSAVGKSSIINALKKEQVAKVDTFSKKIERGKQTTRTVQLFKFGTNKYLADTAGFSKLDESLLEISEKEIKDYYPEFLSFAEKCRFKTCLHINCKECGVLDAVASGKVCNERYENYKKMFAVVKNIKKF